MNGGTHTLPAPTIAAALAALKLTSDAAHVAIALNEVVIRRTQWEQCVLQSGDRLEIISAVAGG